MISSLAQKAGPVLLAALAGAAVTFAVVDASDPAPLPVARAWIDQPLDGAVLPEDTVAITVHATDPDGVSTVVLTVDDAEIHTAELDGGDELVTVELDWEPDGPGTHVLDVVAEDGEGTPGVAASATFTVGTRSPVEGTTTTTRPGEPSTTETTAPEDSTTTETTEPGSTTTTGSTVTTRPPATTTTGPTTTAPCRPSVPQLANPPDGADVRTRTPRLTWVYSGCRPDQFRVEVSDADGTYLVTKDVPGSQTNITWDPVSCDTTFYWRVRAIAAGGTSAWSSVRSLFVVC